MFTARVFIVIVQIIQIIYDEILNRAADRQRKKPLPDEVADIYDAERYQKYIDFVTDKKKLRFKYKTIGTITDWILIFSPIYTWIEKVCKGNPYLVFLLTYAIMFAVGAVLEIWGDYQITFGIMEKYGMNKKDLKEFVKDEVLGQSFELFATIVLSIVLIYIGEHLSAWTNGFTVGYAKTLLLCAGIAVVLFIIYSIIKVISYVLLRKQYVFTPLEEGTLKEKILKLQEGSKKKVKQINVYNESKKSTTKNAFLLKLFWHREFGIADNFMNENAEDELLAVLSHEIGHLKHKKDLTDYIGKAIKLLQVGAIVCVLVNPAIALKINVWIRESFGVTVNNYYVLLVVWGTIVHPIMYITGIYGAYLSRRHEYEADREAVKNGYGESLIGTFKAMSSDELVNVNPHPFIEFTEYSHPGMYRRIKAIRDAELRYAEK